MRGLDGLAGACVVALFTCAPARSRGSAGAGLVEAGHGAFQVADGRFGLGGVAFAELGLEQADVVFGVAEVGIFSPCAPPGEHLFGGFVVAGLDGEFAQAAQAPDPVGRQGGGVGSMLRADSRLPAASRARGKPVVGVHEKLVSLTRACSMSSASA